jgi:hypothetical protein
VTQGYADIVIGENLRKDPDDQGRHRYGDRPYRGDRLIDWSAEPGARGYQGTRHPGHCPTSWSRSARRHHRKSLSRAAADLRPCPTIFHGGGCDHAGLSSRIRPGSPAGHPPCLRYYGINATSLPRQRHQCCIDAVIDRTQDGEEGISGTGCTSGNVATTVDADCRGEFFAEAPDRYLRGSQRAV